MSVDDLSDTLAGESLLPETPLDVIEHFSMRGVILVQNVLKLKIRGTKAVTEMLCENPAAVWKTMSKVGYKENRTQLTCVCGLLNSVASQRLRKEERVVGQTEEQ